jgi:hypothetical protein
MRIASDVLGTLKGHKGDVIHEALTRLIAQGHEVVVWSSDYGLAVNEAKQRGLDVNTATSKFAKYEANEQGKELFDVAIEDDHMQKRYLAAKRFIMVDEITDVDSLVNMILNPSPVVQNENQDDEF